VAQQQANPWIGPVIVAAIVSGVVALVQVWLNARREAHDRQRKLFDAAFEACMAYRELPYMVRRRRADQPAEERIRLSTVISETQRRLNHHQAVLRVEAPRVAQHYRELVAATREIAGAEISRAWDLDPSDSDADMHIRDIDLTALARYEDAYLTAAADHLRFGPPWLRRLGRRVHRRLGKWQAGVAPASRFDSAVDQHNNDAPDASPGNEAGAV
jgi:hypothetical protein